MRWFAPSEKDADTSLRLRVGELVAPLFTQTAIIGLRILDLRRTRDLLLPRLLSEQVNLEEN